MKRILLLCGCLEPGKDGVGDYCLMFASELRQQGLEILLCSMQDSYVEEPTTAFFDGFSLFRLPVNYTWHQKRGLLKNHIIEIKPDHISLQFVIYAYHVKGLPFVAMHHIQKLLSSFTSVSIMLHEPWIGRSTTESFRRRLIGFIQRQMIRRTIYNIQPSMVHTSNGAFQTLLSHFGIKVKILPLFSNIPFVKDEQLQVKAWLAKKNLKIEDDALKVGLFGRLPLRWKSKELFRALKNEKAVFFLLGKSDPAKVEELKAEAAQIAPNLQIINFGEQSASFVSGVFQYWDAGVAVTSPQILGKSGVVAAYREHGLPVILAGEDEFFRQVSVNPQLEPNHVLLSGSMIEQLKNINKREVLNTRSTVAKQWIQDILK